MEVLTERPSTDSMEGMGPGAGPGAEVEAEAEERAVDGSVLVRGGAIAVPLQIDVSGQTLPVHTVLRAILTSREVEVNCCCGWRKGSEREGSEEGSKQAKMTVAAVMDGALLKFGRCFVGQSVVREVSLRSTSLLPMKFGFVGVPAEVGAVRKTGEGHGVEV